jgi:prepilin-type N-terminal cleavage/methylation domain-containing protein
MIIIEVVLFMRKSGFTLVELLGVIVVLAIISTIAVSVYTTVFDKQKETAFENKAELIELSAVKWATELNISKSTTITVAKLVNDSYYQADDVKDDEAIVNDPRDNSSLLCNTISITIDNGSPVATLNEEQDCELKEVEIDS